MSANALLINGNDAPAARKLTPLRVMPCSRLGHQRGRKWLQDRTIGHAGGPEHKLMHRLFERLLGFQAHSSVQVMPGFDHGNEVRLTAINRYRFCAWLGFSRL